jgi:zinc protease
MKRLLLLLFIGGLMLQACSTSNESEPSTEMDPGSGIHRAVLPDGMTVLVLPRPTAPTVAVQIWYRVGSADERDGERGLAHFLEHLMFKGTESLPKGEIDALTHRNGGRNNAFTSNDVTVYHFTFAPDRWETALRIEADRMSNTVFDPKEFEAERRVVLEELKQGLDEPWDAMDNALLAAAFGVHPYRHPVIGYAKDLEEVSRETVRDFYRRHYTPANAMLVVAGRVEPDDALEKVAAAFAEVEGPPAPDENRAPEPPQAGEKRVVSRKETTTVDRFELAWHTCRASNADDAVLDVIRALLGVGRSSRLKSRLIESESLMTDVAAGNDTRIDPGLFWIWGELTTGTEPAHVEKIIYEEMGRLNDPAALPAADLVKAKNQAEAAIVFDRETSDGAANEIGNLAVMDSWLAYGKRLASLRAVTAEDVARVANLYFRPDNRTFGLGTGPEPKAKRAARVSAGGAMLDLTPRRVVLDNGLVLIILRKTEAPVAAVRAHVRAGLLVESRPGLANLTGQMLLAGAGERTRAEIAEAIESAGGTISSFGRGTSIRVLARDLALAVEITSEALRRPTFPEAELGKRKERVLSELAGERDVPQTIALRRFSELAYGPGHPHGRNPRGDPKSVEETTREHLVAHHAAWFKPNNTVLTIVGDVDPDQVEKLVRTRFMDWKKGDLSARPKGDVPLPERVIHERIERPGRQVNVYLGHAGIRRRHSDYAALLVLDNVLGLSSVFSDRLSIELREKRGLCYSTWSSITSSASTEPGLFTAFVGTSPETADEAIAAIRAEIARIRDEPVTAQELAAAKSYLTGSMVFGYETAAQIAQRLAEMERFDLGFDAPQRLAGEIMAVTVEDIARVARAHLHPDRLVIVEVGPEK